MIPLPKLLNSSNQEVRRIRPIDVSVNEKIVPLSYASMQLAENESIPVLSYIELFTPNGSAGVFRTKTRPSAYGDAMPTVELEHAITEVGDYLVREDIESEMTLAQAIPRLFGHYRGNKWQFASVSSTTKVIVDTDYEPVLTAILNVLEQVPQYYLAFDFTTSPWTVSLAQRGTTVSAEGRLGRNVRSAVVTPDESEFCTRVYLEGLPKVSGQGEIGYIDADTKSTYGIKERILSGSGDLTSDQANRKATAYLNSHKHPKLGIRISGEDFSSITGETLDRVAIGKLYRLAVPDYNTTVEENVTGISWNSVYNNPLDVTIELAEEEDKLVEFLRKQSSSESNTAKSSSRSGKRNAAAINQAKTHWEQSVQGVVDEDGNITAASIAISINKSTGESEARIDAQRVYIGNDKSTTVIAGKCQLSDVTANYIAGKIADLSVLNVAAISAAGNIHTSNGYIAAPYYYIGSGNSLQNMASGIWALRKKPNTNTLQKKDWDDSDWVDVATFSQAVSSWTWGGGSGKINVTALPQNQTKSVKVSIDGYSRITSNGTFTYTVDYENSSGDDVSTGATKSVTVSIEPKSVERKSSGISGTSLGDVSSGSGSYVTFTVGGSKYYLKIA